MLRLFLEICAGLLKLFQGRAASQDRAQERDIGAAMQREEDLRHEQNRLGAAGRADLERLPDAPDPLDRDSPV